MSSKIPSKKNLTGGGFGDAANKSGQAPLPTGSRNKSGTTNSGSAAAQKSGGDLAKKAAADSSKKSISKAALGSVGRGLNAAGELKDIKRVKEQDGAAAAAATAGLKAAEAAISKTGVGTLVTSAIRGAQAGLAKVGINIKDQYIVYFLLLIPILSLLPVIILALIVFFAWKHPAAVLKLAFTNFKAFSGAVQALVIENGGASKMAYEVEVGSNSAVAAPGDATKPEEGTYLYLLSQIDWEKAKYQTLPLDSRCEIVTEKVVSVLDGKERSVIKSVQLNTNPGKELGGVARANCINNTYPIWNTMMRSKYVREGINQNLNVRYAYAEPQDSETLTQPSDEFGTTLRDKTLTRIWSRGQAYNKPIQSSPEEVAANDAEVLNFFTNTRQVQKYSSGSYDDEEIECANMYVPKGANYYEKDVDKMNHDLACGINPKDLLLYTTSPDENMVNDPDPNIAIKPKRAALNVVCDMYYNVLAPDNEFAPAVEKYKIKVKDRINSAAVAAWQAMTYADTHQKRFIDIKELSGDFYKIAGMQAGQEYNYTLDYRKTGTALEVDAISRIAGYYNKEVDNIPAIQQTSEEEKEFQNALNLVFFIATKDFPVIGSPCEAARDDGFWNKPEGNTPEAKQQQSQIIGEFYEKVYPAFKKAIAGLDFYARPEESKSISQIYKDLTYEDLRFRLVRIESNTSTAGTEDGPQNFNRMNFGMKAYTNAFTLSMGGKFLTQNEAVARDKTTQIAQAYDDQSRGIGWRLFSIDNPRSFASRLAVASTDKPQNIPGNVGGTLASIFNPIRNAASESGSLTAMLTGESRSAQAASSVYDSQNLKIDPAGMPEIFSEIDPITNARFIEGLKKQNAAVAFELAEYDKCFKEFIPSRFHLYNPPADKVDLYKNVCIPLFDATASRDLNSVPLRYSAYHFHMLQAEALVYLSNPEKEDPNFSAPEGTSLTAATPSPNASGTPTDPSGDTSAMQCPAGTTDAGIGEKFGVERVLMHRIRLCTVHGITVNASIANSLNAMMNDMKAAGINLGGSGYRTFDRQAELRTINGCPDTYNSPSSSCDTPTARPGQSNHENGEAIDFTSGGSSLRAGSAGFKWLSSNAARYGFKNLPSESWHWSINGK
jgi:hypothetical protein